MFMSLVTRTREGETYPELAGSRVVITGVRSTFGMGLAQAFADQNAQLLLQSSEHSRSLGAKKRTLAKSATHLKVFEKSFGGATTPTRFAQEAARSFGSIDTLINLVSIHKDECCGLRQMDQIENLIVNKLSTAREITEVTANRMALTWSEGLILNILVHFTPTSAEESALAGLLKSTLATMTRDQARRWGESAVRINAVAPPTTLSDLRVEGDGPSERDFTALALYLASHKGRSLTGHLFDAEGVSRRTC